METINKRRSIRRFKDADVPNELIKEVLKAGILAPSSKNKQPWKYFVFKGEAKKELLAVMKRGIDIENSQPRLPSLKGILPNGYHTLEIMNNAPVIIMVVNTENSSPFIDQSVEDRFIEIANTLSVGASIENILLEATKQGLGSLWICATRFAYKELCEYLNTDKQLVCAIALGYSDENPDARPRKAFDDVVEFRGI